MTADASASSSWRMAVGSSNARASLAAGLVGAAGCSAVAVAAATGCGAGSCVELLSSIATTGGPLSAKV